MNSNITRIFILLAAFLYRNAAVSQSVEMYSGHQRAGVDLMWFKYLKNAESQNTPFLFFSRNRASVDYSNDAGLLGSVNAVSYNFRNGLGIVSVASFQGSGLTGKAGIQYFTAKRDFMFFGWLVADLKKQGNVDLFGLFRYQPLLSGQLRLFAQAEMFPVFRPATETWNLTERIRLGLKRQSWSAGLMADWNQYGKSTFTKITNAGVFLRHEF